MEKQQMTGNTLGDGLVSLIFICIIVMSRGPEQD